MCAPRMTRHTSIRYSSSCHTRFTVGPSIHSTSQHCHVMLQAWIIAAVKKFAWKYCKLSATSYIPTCRSTLTSLFRKENSIPGNQSYCTLWKIHCYLLEKVEGDISYQSTTIVILFQLWTMQLNIPDRAYGTVNSRPIQSSAADD
jgi:hypothetical protein